MTGRKPSDIPLIAGLGEIAGDYDGFIIDLWGTVHDGLRALPGAIEALERLGQAGKRRLILSNAPRRNDAVIARMDRIGIPASAYDGVLASGEAVWLALRDRADPWHAALGRACYVIGGAGDDSAVVGLGLDLVEDIGRADFVVAVGLSGPGATVADYAPVLAAARARGLPMICANPDLEVLRGTAREPCAGALAQHYEELGGEVFRHGKPHAAIYRSALEVLEVEDPVRVLAVGDSLRTDIAGAAAAGMDSLLITGGIHAATLGCGYDIAPAPDRLAALCAEIGARPTAAAAGFCW